MCIGNRVRHCSVIWGAVVWDVETEVLPVGGGVWGGEGGRLGEDLPRRGAWKVAEGLWVTRS